MRLQVVLLCIALGTPALRADVTVKWDDEEWCSYCQGNYTWVTECEDAEMDLRCKVKLGIPTSEVLEVGAPQLVCQNVCTYCEENGGAEPSCECSYSQTSGYTWTLSLGFEVDIGSIWEIEGGGSYTYSNQSTIEVTNSADYAFGNIVTIQVFEIGSKIAVSVEAEMSMEVWVLAEDCPDGEKKEELLNTLLCGSREFTSEQYVRTYNSVVNAVACP